MQAVAEISACQPPSIHAYLGLKDFDMQKRKRLVFGIGINDSIAPVYELKNGKRARTPAYRCWVDMLKRCYSDRYHLLQPTYANCTVCDEWLIFSRFKEWFDTQHKEPGWQIDKDLLCVGNKIYCPDFCVFVPRQLNLFFNDKAARSGDCMLGVDWDRGKFRAKCHNPFTRKQEHLGYFDSEHEAHMAWIKRKHEIACDLSLGAHDARVAHALRSRFAGRVSA